MPFSLPLSHKGRPVSIGSMLKSHRRPGRFVVSGVLGDAHTWNLAFLQQTLHDAGHEVVNLGAGQSGQEVVRACLGAAPDVLVISSVDGEGHHDAARLVRTVREHPALEPLRVVFGGRLAPEGEADAGRERAQALTRSGFDAVFECAGNLTGFGDFLCELRIGRRRSSAARAA